MKAPLSKPRAEIEALKIELNNHTVYAKLNPGAFANLYGTSCVFCLEFNVFNKVFQKT